MDKSLNPEGSLFPAFAAKVAEPEKGGKRLWMMADDVAVPGDANP